MIIYQSVHKFKHVNYKLLLICFICFSCQNDHKEQNPILKKQELKDTITIAVKEKITSLQKRFLDTQNNSGIYIEEIIKTDSLNQYWLEIFPKTKQLVYSDSLINKSTTRYLDQDSFASLTTMNDTKISRFFNVHDLDTIYYIENFKTDTLYKTQYEFYQDELDANFYTRYYSKSKLKSLKGFIYSKNDFVKDSINTLKHLNQTDVLSLLEFPLTKYEDIQVSKTLKIDSNTFSIISLSNYHKSHNRILIYKNEKLVDSLSGKYLMVSLKKLPVLKKDNVVLMSKFVLPDTDMPSFNSITFLNINKENISFSTTNRLDIDR